MAAYRCLSTAASVSQRPVSDLVKKMSRFASHEELFKYAQRPIDYCYAARMIEACSPHHRTPVSLIQTAVELREQLLVRVAHCISCFQSLPFLPASNPVLLALHDRYRKLFESLAKIPMIETDADEENFFQSTNTLMAQNSDVIKHLSTGCREASKHFKSYACMRTFLDNLLSTRLTMRLLAEHYLELRKRQKRRIRSDHWRGAICMEFSPAKMVQECIDAVSSVCLEKYGIAPPVHVEDLMGYSVPYFPDVVEYIVRELLKNAMRALVEHHLARLSDLTLVKAFFEAERDEPLCKVLITTDRDDEHFNIVIRDQGGGIDESPENLFQYLYTGRSDRSA